MKCRIDKNSEVVELFSLGDLFVSDFIPMDEESESHLRTPLTMCLSRESGLVQLKDTADFDAMYKRYWYNSGTNATMTKELQDIVRSVLDVRKVRGKLRTEDIWVDIGCNDGTLLESIPSDYYKIGFDPATNNCQQAYEKADMVINDYFSKKAFMRHMETGKASVVTSIAMFYDLPDPLAFCQDVYDILEDDGLWVIQMSYLPLMLDQLAFDNICHEHLEYYSLEVLNNLLVSTGFKIVDCQLNDINGGSFRVYVQKDMADVTTFGTAPYRDVCNFRVKSILSHEDTLNLKDPKTYTAWFKKIQELKEQTVSFIEGEVAKGKTVWVYGASTKGNTLLQYFGLDNTLISGAAERQPQKYGLKTVGTNIPIYDEDYVRAQNPDYMLVLPWHFINEFCEREADFLEQGGKFIVPCPTFEVIGNE